MQVINKKAVNFYTNYTLTKTIGKSIKPNSFRDLFKNVRPNKNIGLKQMIKEMIIKSPSYQVTNLLIKELEQLGKDFIDICYRCGINIIILSEKESQGKVSITYRKTPTSFNLEPLEKNKACGIYSDDLRLILLNEKYIKSGKPKVGIHELSHAYENSVGYEFIKKLVINLANNRYSMFDPIERQFLQKIKYIYFYDKEYFANCVENYFDEDKKYTLLEEEPVMYDLIELLLSDAVKKDNIKKVDFVSLNNFSNKILKYLMYHRYNFV